MISATDNRQSISSCNKETTTCPRVASAESSSVATSSMSSSSCGVESSPASRRSSVSTTTERDMNIMTPPLKAKETQQTTESTNPTTEDENEEDPHHDSFASFDDDDDDGGGGVVGQIYECEIQGFEESFASFEMEVVEDNGEKGRGTGDYTKQEASISHIDACFGGSTNIKTLNNSGDCPPAVPSRVPSRRRSSSRGRLHSSGSDLTPSRPKRHDEGDAGDDGEMSSNSRRGRLTRNKSTKVTTPGGRRRSGPGGAMAMSCSALNFDASFSAGCPRTPLSRERSKLCRLSGSNSTLNTTSNHNSNHSSTSRGSRGSRGSTQRRRAAQLPPSIDLMMNTSNSTDSDSKFDGSASVAIMNFDGDSSVAQLQVGDFLMLANKELATSSHLRRRMPKRNTRRANRSARSTAAASDPDGDEDGEGANNNNGGAAANDVDDVHASHVQQKAVSVVEVQE
eukprot:CAMPEP_0113519610 /NCGR_PEP_ID=MMETSP0014_2-20120614/43620_1 /TAXON_ID=2857 /ORGANISM="Nitzschia sp." /LENGTH=453 /DNA_ID=CAMNT_0000417357 /DNA_START=209 /DNA_END=1570 /DNA_ORIENTATION=+ /assembly_acc=CAM_ASM_000159